MQRNAEADDPLPVDLHRMGTVANIVRYITAPDGTHHLICQGEQRFRVVDYLTGWPFFVAETVRIPEPAPSSDEIEARFVHLKGQAIEAIQLLPQAPNELLATIQGIDSPGALADMVATFMDATPDEKQEILETVDIGARMERVSRLLAHRIEVLRLSQEIGRETKASLDARNREVLLREQMAAIQRQLGEADEGKTAEIAELEKAIANAKMPKEVEDQARKELRRLQRMPEAAGEYGMVRTYLDWLVELPWALPEEAPIDIAAARRILDEDHFGLEKIKRRIIEYLAVRKLAPDGKAPILCFVGPPGRRQDVARPVDRARHEPQIRARQPRRRARRGGDSRPSANLHRRPARQHHSGDPQGRRAQLRHDARRDRQARRRHPGRPGLGAAGSARSRAEQHLSRQLSRRAVRSQPRRVHRHREHARHDPRAAARPHGDHQPSPATRRARSCRSRAAISFRANWRPTASSPTRSRSPTRRSRTIIQHYTREAGVRSLEREIGRALRQAAMRIAEGEKRADRDLGRRPREPSWAPPPFEDEVAMRTSVPGVATGLAWTPVGGDILFIEATATPGNGRLILTGQLGEVMKESAQAALSIVKNRGGCVWHRPARFEKTDIHIHVPAGATPKDGPSAGVAMFMALVSLMTDRTVRSDTAMTGEISLRGLVLPVGGIKEKVVAAHRAGIKRVMLPARNRKDFEDIPEEVRQQLTFVWLERVDEAVSSALERSLRRRGPRPPRA